MFIQVFVFEERQKNEEIVLGTYGIPKKWYFPFTKSYWTGEVREQSNWTKKLLKNRFIKWIMCRKRRMCYEFNWSITNLNNSGGNQRNQFE